MLLCGSVFFLGVGVGYAESSEPLKQARIITGYAKGDSQAWDPMADEDRSYIASTGATPSQWFQAKPGQPFLVGSAEDLQRLVYDMAYTLRSMCRVGVTGGVLPRDLRKWLRRFNTSIYGNFTLEQKDGQYYVRATYRPEDRVVAAFRNPDMEAELEPDEKKVLEVCGWWISQNISKNMPNGLKLKRIHDAIIDTSTYEPGRHHFADLLLKGQGSCVAYATAMQMMLHMVKIDCRIVTGTDAMNHVWNLVDLNDEWYHLDVAWNDPEAELPLRMYDYYLLTDVEMDSTHDWVDSELHPETPEVNPWHYWKKNDVRRSWTAARLGYSLPREKDKIPDNYARRYEERNDGRLSAVVKKINRQREQFNATAGKVRRAGKEYNKQVNDRSRSLDERVLPSDLSFHYKKYGRSLSGKKGGEKIEAEVANERELSDNLRKWAEELSGPRIEVRCKKDTPLWRMREMIAKSDINLYAERYNAIFDDANGAFSLDIVYWPHVRLLSAARNEIAKRRISKIESELLGFCVAGAKKVILGQDTKEDVKRLQKYAIQRCVCRTKNVVREPLATYVYDFRNDKGKMCSPGVAETMHVMMQLADIPCMMVHGRDATRDRAWNLVRVNQREWYHCDAYSQCYNGNPEKYCLSTDEKIREDHAWDVEEVPLTPTEVEQEVKKNVEG